jgi:3-oxoisoapionate decarboxylase
MRFGLCKWSFTPVHTQAGTVPNPWDAAGCVTVASEYGLKAIELDVEDFEGDGASVEALVADIRERGLPLILDTGGEESPEAIGRSVEHALEVGARVGAVVVRTTISSCLEGDRSRYGYAGWKHRLEELVAPLHRAAVLAQHLGIPFGIENHQDVCSAELAWLCDRVGNRYCGVVLDCGNAFAVGEHPSAFATRVAPYLKSVQLKDYVVHPTPSGWRFVRCALGAGVVDFKALIPQIDREAPGLIGCIELGASSARHVRLFEADWWATYDERPWPEVRMALQVLHAQEESRDLEWRTPHERGEDPGAAAAYETDQLAATVAYLRTLDGP